MAELALLTLSFGSLLGQGVRSPIEFLWDPLHLGVCQIDGVILRGESFVFYDGSGLKKSDSETAPKSVVGPWDQKSKISNQKTEKSIIRWSQMSFFVLRKQRAQ